MDTKLTILPLKLTQHSDRASILTAYSRESGAMGFVVPIGSGNAARRRKALLMPLSPLEVIASVKAGRDLATFREPRALMPLHIVSADPIRMSLVMFLSEVLQAILRNSDGDATTFDFIVDAMARLNDPTTPTANFHLTFLTHLAEISGIAPDVSEYRPGMVFDMLDGCFRQSAALHGKSLGTIESAAVAHLLRINWDNMIHYKYTREQRATLLDGILEYYTLHLANLSNLKSPSILRELLR